MLHRSCTEKVVDMVNIALKRISSRNYEHYIHVHFARILWRKTYLEDICEHTCLAFSNGSMPWWPFYLGDVLNEAGHCWIQFQLWSITRSCRCGCPVRDVYTFDMSLQHSIWALKQYDCFTSHVDMISNNEHHIDHKKKTICLWEHRHLNTIFTIFSSMFTYLLDPVHHDCATWWPCCGSWWSNGISYRSCS